MEDVSVEFLLEHFSFGGDTAMEHEEKEEATTQKEISIKKVEQEDDDIDKTNSSKLGWARWWHYCKSSHSFIPCSQFGH